MGKTEAVLIFAIFLTVLLAGFWAVYMDEQLAIQRDETKLRNYELQIQKVKEENKALELRIQELQLLATKEVSY